MNNVSSLNMNDLIAILQDVSQFETFGWSHCFGQELKVVGNETNVERSDASWKKFYKIFFSRNAYDHFIREELTLLFQKSYSTKIVLI